MTNHQQFVSDCLNKWIEDGFSCDEMTKAAGMVADMLEEADAKGMSVREVCDTFLKQANLGLAGAVPSMLEALPLAWMGGALNSGKDKALDLASKGIQGAASYAVPTALGAGVAAVGLPYVLGNLSGKAIGENADDWREGVRNLQDRETLAALRDATQRLKQTSPQADEESDFA
jgi:hypothetical protein